MRTTLRLATAGLATTALLFTAAPPASAELVVGEGMKGIKIGFKKKTVIRKLGTPVKTIKGRNDFGRFQILKYRRSFVVNLTNKVVTSMSTKWPSERTDDGVGVGSTRGQVKRGVPGAVCESIGGVKVCHVGDFEPGEIVTEFRLHHRIVTMIVIGRVLD